MMEVQLALTIDGNDTITCGEMRTSSCSSMPDSAVVEVYGDVTDYITGNVSAQMLREAGIQTDAVLLFEHRERYSYNNSTVTHLSSNVVLCTINNDWVE